MDFNIIVAPLLFKSGRVFHIRVVIIVVIVVDVAIFIVIDVVVYMIVFMMIVMIQRPRFGRILR